MGIFSFRDKALTYVCIKWTGGQQVMLNAEDYRGIVGIVGLVGIVWDSYSCHDF